MAYNLFKFLHVAGAIVWLGSVSTLTLLNARLARAGDDGARGELLLARASGAMGRTVVGPAALVTLLAGGVTAAVGGISMGSLWTLWGFAGIVVSMGLGSTLIRRTTGALETALAEPQAATADVTSLRGRLTVLNVINLLVLLSVVAAMVFKPTL